MVYALLLTLPFGLLGLMLAMDRVERPLRQDALSEHLLEFLDSARPDEVETYVQQGFAPALDSYWRRRHPGVPTASVPTPSVPTASVPTASVPTPSVHSATG
jgi:hypothetical protein